MEHFAGWKVIESSRISLQFCMPGHEIVGQANCFERCLADCCLEGIVDQEDGARNLPLEEILSLNHRVAKELSKMRGLIPPNCVSIHIDFSEKPLHINLILLTIVRVVVFFASFLHVAKGMCYLHGVTYVEPEQLAGDRCWRVLRAMLHDLEDDECIYLEFEYRG